jgi:HSP20 family protein
METLLDRYFRPEDGLWGTPERFMPRTNVAETETQFEVTLELPGMVPEEFNVEFREGSLWISGEKKEEKEEKGKTFHRIERRYGQFQRVIPLGTQVDEKHVKAEYKEGILRVTVPKTEAAKPHRIEVKA